MKFLLTQTHAVELTAAVVLIHEINKAIILRTSASPDVITLFDRSNLREGEDWDKLSRSILTTYAAVAASGYEFVSWVSVVYRARESVKRVQQIVEKARCQ